MLLLCQQCVENVGFRLTENISKGVWVCIHFFFPPFLQGGITFVTSCSNKRSTINRKNLLQWEQILSFKS